MFNKNQNVKGNRNSQIAAQWAIKRNYLNKSVYEHIIFYVLMNTNLDSFVLVYNNSAVKK